MIWTRALIIVVGIASLAACSIGGSPNSPGSGGGCSWWGQLFGYCTTQEYQPPYCSDPDSDDAYSAPDGRRKAPSGGGAGPTIDTAMDGVRQGMRIPQKGLQGGSAEAVNEEQVNFASWLERLEFDGSPLAGGIRRGLPLSPEESALAAARFDPQSRREGVLGFHRLGLAYLGPDAFEIAKTSKRLPRRRVGLYVPYCSDEYPPVTPNEAAAYTYFRWAKRCHSIVAGSPNVDEWLDGIKNLYELTSTQVQRLEKEADVAFEEEMRAQGFDPDDVQQEQQFCRGDPGGSLPQTCPSAKTSRQALKLGESSYAEGSSKSIAEARACWRRAIQIVKDDDDADAAVAAQRRLQTMTTTCTWSKDSLAAINRDYEARSADLITVSTIQNALKALGHYDGPIDGQLSLATRIAIRKYQRERSEDETDILTPLQITNLVCNAAETTRSPMAANTLGLMYTVGLGVKQNIDKAQQWLTEAANRNHAEAKYNLALLYGTGIILKSYRLCDVPRAPEQADKYLQEAAGQGLPKALELLKECRKFSSLAAPERWMLIERQLIDRIRSGPFANNFRSIGKNCVYEGTQHEPTGAQE